MPLTFPIVYVIGSIFLLYIGAKGVTVGSKNISIALGISKLVVGLTVIAIATGSPELIVTLIASIKGENGIAIGNIVGSNLINTLLVMGVALLIRPIDRERELMQIEMPMMIITSAALTICVVVGTLPRWVGGIFVAAMVGMMVLQIKARSAFPLSFVQRPKRLWLQIASIVLGAFALIVGGKYFIEGAVAIARHFHIPNSVIAVTLIAFGTSLPELATCIYSSMKGHSDLTLGNIIGSNIYNILGVLGICALVHPLHVSNLEIIRDTKAMMIAALVLYGLFIFRDRLHKTAGVFLLLLYIGYTIYIL